MTAVCIMIPFQNSRVREIAAMCSLEISLPYILREQTSWCSVAVVTLRRGQAARSDSGGSFEFTFNCSISDSFSSWCTRTFWEPLAGELQLQADKAFIPYPGFAGVPSNPSITCFKDLVVSVASRIDRPRPDDSSSTTCDVAGRALPINNTRAPKPAMYQAEYLPFAVCHLRSSNVNV